ncbi:response regulator [uncultured Clostridium sp.]|uniref:response regulator n=1 Tax=uncultured Clostridium sp. TaxID=59620 RepID=UPI0034A0B68B
MHIIRESYRIDKFTCGEGLLNSSHSKYNVIFLDIKMQGISGIDTAKEIRETNEEVKIIFLGFQL